MNSAFLQRFRRIGVLVRPICFVVLLGGVVLLPSGCAKEDAAGAGGSKRGVPVVPVRVAAVVERTLAPRLTVVGTVTPKRTSVVASGADGVVQSYGVEEGEWVKKGAVLSRLRMESSDRVLAEAVELLEQYRQEWEEMKSFRAEEVAQAKFRKAAARTLRDIARKKYAREERAYKNGAINEDQLDDARERAEQTEALFRAAEQNHRQMVAGPRKEKRLQAERKMKAQQEHVGFLKAEAAKRTTKAPISGFVVKEHSFVGQWLSKGDPVAAVAMLDEVDVVVIVDQSNIRHVRIGEKTLV
ncbi:MAG: HlyD family secretion protein, partial [Planctomycetaceae bacterium]